MAANEPFQYLSRKCGDYHAQIFKVSHHRYSRAPTDKLKSQGQGKGRGGVVWVLVLV
jgi:hypothetical protein